MKRPPTPVALFQVRVKVRAQRAELLGWRGEELKVAVRAAPEGGRANRELLQVVSRALDLGSGMIELASGAVSRVKILRVRGISQSDLERRIEAALEKGREK